MKTFGCNSISSLLGVILLSLTPALVAQEDQGQAVLTATRQVTAILDTVKDAATAQSARPGLQQAAESLFKAVQALQANKKKGGAMSKKSSADLDAANEKFHQALGKVNKLEPAKKELGPILSALSQF